MDDKPKWPICLEGVPHAKSCGPVYTGSNECIEEECACGCTAFGDYCLESTNPGC